ncbi:MAG TPA: hypothetical protein VGG49_10570 [Steroidobacteraceae bacterium]
MNSYFGDTTLDIVLHIEALTPAFGTTFWAFVEAGGYEIRQASGTGKPILYRFQEPASAEYPAMLELFCRVPEGIHLASGAHLTPIPFDDAVASLPAILLEDEYYTFIMNGRRIVEGLPWISELIFRSPQSSSDSDRPTDLVADDSSCVSDESARG